MAYCEHCDELTEAVELNHLTGVPDGCVRCERPLRDPWNDRERRDWRSQGVL